MVREQGPGIDGEPRFPDPSGKASHEVGSVPVVAEDGGSRDPAHHHVVERPGRVEASLAGHGGEASMGRRNLQRPL